MSFTEAAPSTKKIFAGPVKKGAHTAEAFVPTALQPASFFSLTPDFYNG